MKQEVKVSEVPMEPLKPAHKFRSLVRANTASRYLLIIIINILIIIINLLIIIINLLIIIINLLIIIINFLIIIINLLIIIIINLLIIIINLLIIIINLLIINNYSRFPKRGYKPLSGSSARSLERTPQVASSW